jgi:MFS family permease
MAEGAMADWSSLYYRQVLEDKNKVSTTGYTAFTFAMALGRLTGDRLIQILRFRNTLILNGLLIVLGLTLALGWQVPIAVISGYALVGLGVSSVIPIVYMIAGKSKTMAPSAALATVSTIGFTGFLIGPPVIGLIAHETSLRIALLLVVLLGFIIVFLAATAVKNNDSHS